MFNSIKQRVIWRQSSLGAVTALWLALSLLLNACGEDSTPAGSLSLPTTAAATTQATATTAVATTQAASATTAAASTAVATTPATITAPAPISQATTSAPLQPTATTAPTQPATTLAASNTQPAIATKTAAAVPTIMSSAAVQQEFDTIGSQTEKTRGLKFKQKVDASLMTRDDLAKYQEDEFRRTNPPSELAKYEKFLRVLALVPPNFDLTRTYIDLLNEQVLGFYDSETKRLYMVVDSGDPNKLNPLVKFTAEHELTHALQDQNFDLKKVLPQRKPADKEWNDDLQYALTALVEGDAVQSQLVWIQGGNLKQADLQEMLKSLSSFSSDKLDKSPLILRETLTFPYQEGAAFVAQLYKNGGWAAVDKAFSEQLPQSTSQILHSDKYDKRIAPISVQLPSQVDILGNGWQSIEINVMGEMQARVWLQGALDKTAASQAVKAWAGDKFQVVENAQGALGVVWRSQWDSPAAATDFYNASVTTLKKLYNLSGEGSGADPKRTWSSAAQDVALVRKGSEVLITVLPKGAALNKVISGLGF